MAKERPFRTLWVVYDKDGCYDGTYETKKDALADIAEALSQYGPYTIRKYQLAPKKPVK